jgi:hypothetical protein
LRVSRKPTISTSSPYLDDPALDPAGHHRTAAGDGEDVLDRHQERLVDLPLRLRDERVDRVEQRLDALDPVVRVLALERLERRAADDRRVVAGELVLAEQLAQLELDQVDQLLVALADQVALVEVHDQRRHVDLPRQEHVLARLRHRTIGRAHHQDRAVHLRRPGDHVLDVVSVARAIDVRVVALRRLVLDVRGRDRDPARLLLRRLVDLVERGELGQALRRLHLRDRGGERGLAVIHVTDGPDVDVRLVPDELFLGHLCYLWATSPSLMLVGISA